ncbi:relaxase/mobilization nuclease domain-containing protein [Vibrio scophthalmi]|uniref:MobA/VirD2-like nuclease domain-containing protein n=1 Tax=Vibrio scophthalmi TaxID=45658 RepID=A0A1E3WIS3_9VIBR|nr:relaxase/mobilization nuclease domain-containing protein [Vibrio scophthalmi]ODS09625.1 hypothetical protein VSF3289_03289 [Vibrio scophthalmi]
MLIRPEDELATWGKTKSLYLKDPKKQQKPRGEFESEVVFKTISHIKGKQSGARLINYITRNHHTDENVKHEELIRSEYTDELGNRNTRNNVIVCDELGNRLSYPQIEQTKSAWAKEFIDRKDTGRVLSHFVFSSDKIKDPLEMSRIVNETLSKTIGKEGFRYLTAVHNDTDALHCHVVVNTYNEILQRKLNISKEWTVLQRMTFAETARKHGYKHVATMKRWRGQSIGDSEGVIQNAKLLEFGAAPYQFNDDNSGSFYIKLDNGATIWGIGLADALGESGVSVGDNISVSHVMAKDVVVTDKNGNEISSKRNQWLIEKVDRPLKLKKEKPSYSAKDFEVVQGAKKLMTKHALLQKAKDLARMEVELKNPTPAQQVMLKSLMKDVPKKTLEEARLVYKRESDPLYQSKLKQVRYLESQLKKGHWKETLTHKALEVERSMSFPDLKARVDLLFPKDVDKKALRHSFAVQQKTQAQIQAIPLLRKLNPEKVPLLIKQLEKEIPNVAISDKYKVQLQKGLAKQTQAEFHSQLERRVATIRQHLTHDKPLSANQELSKVYAALKGQPRQAEISKTLTELRTHISVKRKALTSELSQLRVTNKDLAKGFSSTMTAKERLALNRQIDPVAKRINQIETGLGFKQSQTQTIKHSR